VPWELVAKGWGQVVVEISLGGVCRLPKREIGETGVRGGERGGLTYRPEGIFREKKSNWESLTSHFARHQ